MTTKLPSNHPDYNRQQRLSKLFNISLEEYDAILKFQGGLCAICKFPPKTGGNRLSVDHNHKTGLVRGLLCWNCNRALGRLGDDTDRILAMAEYMVEPPAVRALGEERLGRKGRVTNKARKRRRSTSKRSVQKPKKKR